MVDKKIEDTSEIIENEEVVESPEEKLEAEKLEAEKLEAEKLEAEKLEAEKLEAEKGIIKYRPLDDYNFNSSAGANFLKKGKIYTVPQLIQIFGGEGPFNYRMTCTDLKNCLELVKEISKSKKGVLMLLVNDDLIVDDTNTLKKGDKITFAELVKLYTKKIATKLLKEKKLIEIKAN